mmetsp:Transcript_87390/g.168192  ORF Transcript_87390/g.168192 Transcript_87390/m.168192 type:complete len:81 (-) Transcript_87390:824-1066(-)
MGSQGTGGDYTAGSARDTWFGPWLGFLANRFGIQHGGNHRIIEAQALASLSAVQGSQGPEVRDWVHVREEKRILQHVQAT